MALGPITLGYNDRKVNGAIARQLKKGIIFSQPATLEVELAERLTRIVPCAQMVRFVKNGSDATTAAVRLARAYTGKDIILACGYHGMHDWYIGSTDNYLGVPVAVREMTKTFPYNDLQALEDCLKKYKDVTAAIVLEAVRVEEPGPGYLQGVRALADKYSVVLIFDEVVTGFRLALAGAQEFYGVTPDLAAFGKGMGNGMPISALVGRAEIMRLIDQGAFVSLTFGGEALSLAASMATIDQLQKRRVFAHTHKLGKILKAGAQKLIDKYALREIAYVNGVDAMPGLFFRPFKSCSAHDLMALFQQEVISRGVLFLGVNYLCAEHCLKDIEKALKAYETGFKTLKKLQAGTPLKNLLKGESFRPVFARNK